MSTPLPTVTLILPTLTTTCSLDAAVDRSNIVVAVVLETIEPAMSEQVVIEVSSLLVAAKSSIASRLLPRYQLALHIELQSTGLNINTGPGLRDLECVRQDDRQNEDEKDIVLCQ